MRAPIACAALWLSACGAAFDDATAKEPTGLSADPDETPGAETAGAPGLGSDSAPAMQMLSVVGSPPAVRVGAASDADAADVLVAGFIVGCGIGIAGAPVATSVADGGFVVALPAADLEFGFAVAFVDVDGNQACDAGIDQILVWGGYAGGERDVDGGITLTPASADDFLPVAACQMLVEATRVPPEQ